MAEAISPALWSWQKDAPSFPGLFYAIHNVGQKNHLFAGSHKAGIILSPAYDILCTAIVDPADDKGLRLAVLHSTSFAIYLFDKYMYSICSKSILFLCSMMVIAYDS